jgi:chromosome partitioning protein
MTAFKRVVFNQKGGVGKSTITANLAAVAAQQGRRALVVDLDPQGNLSHYVYGPDADQLRPSVFDFFDQILNFSLNSQPTLAHVHATPFAGLSLMCSHPELGELGPKLEARYKMYKLRDALNELAKEFDEIWVDTPPALNFFSRSALIACERVLIPFDCDDFSRRALYTLLDNLQEIRGDHNAGLQLEGIIVNQFQPRAALPAKLVAELAAEGLPMLNSKLSSSVKIRESHQSSQPMVYLDPKHKLSQEFVALYQELSGR